MLNAKLKFTAKRQGVSAFSLQPSAFACSGFTLIELLVVISILGLLAALTVPAIKNLGKSNAAASASRQLLDGVGRARQLAIANHTTVFMVFVPTNFWTPNWVDTSGHFTPAWNNLTLAQRTAATNLCDKQLTGFAFVAYGAVGDQPGRHDWHYLAPWQNLPDGSFIASWKFISPIQYTDIQAFNPNTDPNKFIYGFTNMTVPFPTADSPTLSLPCLAFNYLGQLTTPTTTPVPLTQHEYIPLARGSVSPAIDPSTKALQFGPASMLESPPGNSTSSAYNLVDIDPLTGRATLRFQQVQ